MNINYGDKGYIVKYIQAFLNENYDSSIAITGYYDTNTHSNLIKYLNLPNIVINKTEIIDNMKSNFEFIDKYFSVDIGKDIIGFTFDIENLTMFDYISLESNNGYLNIKFFTNYNLGRYDSFINNTDALKSLVNDLYNNTYNYVKWYNDLSSSDKSIINKLFQDILKHNVGEKMYNSRNDITKLLYSYGWYPYEFTNYKNENVTNLSINITAYNRSNIFPNKEAICMINQFNDYILYNTCIRDGVSFDDIVQSCSDKYMYKYKLCLIPCDGKRKYTISHGYSSGINVYIAKCNTNYKSIKRDNTIVNNTISVYLEPGEYYTYETDDLTKTLVVQIPQISNNSLNINTRLLLGDLDSTGSINIDDVAIFDSYWAYNLLMSKYTSRSNFISYLEKNDISNVSKIDISVADSDVGVLISKDALVSISKYNSVYVIRFKLSGFNIGNNQYNYIIEYLMDVNTRKDYIRLISCNENIINKDKIIINDKLGVTAKIIWDNYGSIIYNKSRQAIIKSIQSKAPIVSSNGGNTIIYSYSIDESSNDNKLLVVDVTNLETQEDISNMNIPYNEFVDKQWAVHEKLLNYILEMTINEYSDDSDIEYAQNLIKELLYDKLDTSTCSYDNTMKKLIKEYQEARNISFSTGYIDIETDGYLRKASGNYGY